MCPLETMIKTSLEAGITKAELKEKILNVWPSRNDPETIDKALEMLKRQPEPPRGYQSKLNNINAELRRDKRNY